MVGQLSNAQRDTNPIQEKGTEHASVSPLSPIINSDDSAIAVAMRQTNDASLTCASVEIDENQLPVKLDAQQRPVEITFKMIVEGVSPTTLSDVKYSGAGNEVSSFIQSGKDRTYGDWKFKYEKNADGSWTGYEPDKAGDWVIHKRKSLGGRADVDLGQITIARDAKTGRVDIHTTGLEAPILGTFVIDDGFMSATALKNKDPLSEKMATSEVIDDPYHKFFSKDRLEELLAEQNRYTHPPLDKITGYKQLIADFDKIANGKKEVSPEDLSKYANDLRNSMIVLAIANTVAKDGKVSYPDELLIQRLFGAFWLRDPDNVKIAQEGITTQLKALGGSASNYSVRFGDIFDRKPIPGNDTAEGPGFTEPPKDRLLEILNKGKTIAQLRISAN